MWHRRLDGRKRARVGVIPDIQTGRRRSLPLVVATWTVDVTPDGQAVFMPDVSGLDARQAAALNERLARARQPARTASRDR